MNHFMTKQAIICPAGHNILKSHDHQTDNTLNESLHDKTGNYMPHWPHTLKSHDHQTDNTLNESLHEKTGNYMPHWP